MFVKYHFANGPLPPPTGCLYDYVVAQNGVFVRAKRPGLQAAVQVCCMHAQIRGLDVIQPYLALIETVPASLLVGFLRLAYDVRPRELLAYLRHAGAGSVQHRTPWDIVVPRQQATPASVHPVDPYDDGGRDALIEIHSHGNMAAFFSATDNRDESTGFRIYAVVGRISSAHPEIVVRVGVYGHFWQIHPSLVFDLPPFMSPQPDWFDTKLHSRNARFGAIPR